MTRLTQCSGGGRAAARPVGSPGRRPTKPKVVKG